MDYVDFTDCMMGSFINILVPLKHECELKKIGGIALDAGAVKNSCSSNDRVNY